MSDPLEELIKEIAVKHGIVVSRDDPILVLQTINSRLMNESSKAQELILDVFKQEIEALTLRWSSDSKDKAERILNAALTASKESMTEIMRDGGNSIVILIKSELETAQTTIAASVQDVHRIAILILIAAMVTLAAAAVALIAAFR